MDGFKEIRSHGRRLEFLRHKGHLIPDPCKIMEIRLAEFIRRKSANAKEAVSGDMEIELHHNQIMLPDDLLHKILLSLPAESLIRIQLVCKQWFSLINSSMFIQAHARQSETGLIWRDTTPLLQGSEDKPRFFFQHSSLEDGDINYVDSSLGMRAFIEASCDGLILLAFNFERRKLKVMNPVTRKQMELPLATYSGFHSFGIAYCKETKTYKVVHLFNRQEKTHCEILSSVSRIWRKIEGPKEFVRDFDQIPACTSGSLHWLAGKDCISINVCDEKFVTAVLPESRRLSGEKLVEMGGDLAYIAHPLTDWYGWQLWILKGCWAKAYSIRLSGELKYCSPLYSRRNGSEMLLQTHPCYGHRLYAYNYETDEVTPVRTGFYFEEPLAGEMFLAFLLHRKTLVSFDAI